jgi:hypothetical protein
MEQLIKGIYKFELRKPYLFGKHFFYVYLVCTEKMYTPGIPGKHCMGISDALTVAAAAIDSDCDRQSEQRGLPVRNCVPTWWPARHQAAMVGSRQTIILHVKTHFL